MEHRNADVIIAGTGVAGLFSALHLPKNKRILMLTKEEPEDSDSFLAQGGICVQRDETDYDSFMEDTLKAGHYENRKESVDIMIRSSREVIDELIAFGVDFNRKNGELLYTREGAHSKPRILYHKDITGKEITSTLLACVKKLSNVEILTQTTMIDIMEKENHCYGIIARKKDGSLFSAAAQAVVWACGGIGGLYEHSTNFPHLTGDALAIALEHGIELEHPDYVQIHPTTLYSTKPGRRFLISESVRGEGAKLYNAKMERFANEVLPRDLMTEAIHRQMELDHKPYVWLDMRPLGEEQIKEHFPNIYQKCLEEGFDVTKECIPVVPAQHYFMGGVKVDSNSRTSMERLYAAGETSCNGVHGANRLASNSLLESLVFAKRAAEEITEILENTNEEQRKQETTAAQLLQKQADHTRFPEKEELERRFAEKVRKEIERVKEAV
ncbi:MAG: L-aspartate oxidase [Blautia sp.]|nr:L-aspartate oxidase [Blautia sp.]